MNTTCRDCLERLSEYLDDELDPVDRRRVDEHVSSCESCAGIARDLEAIRRAADSLTVIEPPARVFEAVAARLDAPPSAPRWWQVAAAVIAVAAATYAVARIDRRAGELALHSSDAPAVAAGNAPAVAAVEADGDQWRTVVTQYETAISTLEQSTTAESSSLDPHVAAALRHDLSLVDAAIEQSRAALQSDPDSAEARDSLSDALQRKVTVLQATASAISETPQGAPR